jgi:uncharacterized protein YoxC
MLNGKMVVIDYIAIALVVFLAISTTYVIRSAIELSNSLEEIEKSLGELESDFEEIEKAADEIDKVIKDYHSN